MKHQFAIFNKNLLISNDNRQIIISDSESYNRIINVLRLNEGEDLIIFDKLNFYELKLVKINKRDILFLILSSNPIMSDKPKINIALGLLKKENFENALHNASLVGINSVQPLYTELIHRNWWSDKFLNRFESVMSAACEQSKNFAMPNILAPLSLTEYLNNHAPKNLMVCDPRGERLAKCSLYEQYTLLIGPEAGFSQSEMVYLNDYHKYSLVDNILTSYDAVFAVGIIMSNLC